jgi:hypothetical protein
LRQAACAATSAEGKQTGLGISTYPGTFLVFLTAGGFTPTQAEPNDGTLVQTTTLLQELLGASCAKIYEISDEGSAQFSNGTMAMILDSSLRHYAIEQAIAVEHNFSPGAASLPGTGAQAAPTLWHGPGMMLLSPEGSRRERAQQVLQWFLEADVQVAWSQSTGYLPVRRSVVERQVQGVGLSTIEKDLFYLLLHAANEGTWITWPESMNSATCRPALVRGLIDHQQHEADYRGREFDALHLPQYEHPMSSHDTWLETAIQTAQEAGGLLRERWGRPHDTAALRATVRRHRSGHCFGEDHPESTPRRVP